MLEEEPLCDCLHQVVTEGVHLFLLTQHGRHLFSSFYNIPAVRGSVILNWIIVSFCCSQLGLNCAVTAGSRVSQTSRTDGGPSVGSEVWLCRSELVAGLGTGKVSVLSYSRDRCYHKKVSSSCKNGAWGQANKQTNNLACLSLLLALELKEFWSSTR